MNIVATGTYAKIDMMCTCLTTSGPITDRGQFHAHRSHSRPRPPSLMYWPRCAWYVNKKIQGPCFGNMHHGWCHIIHVAVIRYSEGRAPLRVKRMMHPTPPALTQRRHPSVQVSDHIQSLRV